MEFFIKDEPLDLDFNLHEQYIIEGKINKSLIGEVKSLVKGLQIFLQESELEMNVMQETFQRIKKRHTENLIITFKVLQLLDSCTTPSVDINHDQSSDTTRENVDVDRPPDVDSDLCSSFHNEDVELTGCSLSSEYLSNTSINSNENVEDDKAKENNCPSPKDQFARHPTTSGVVSKRERPFKVCSFCPKKANDLKTHADENAGDCYQQKKKIKMMTCGRLCPIQGCEEKGKFKRLDNHLKKKHKLSPKSKTYQDLYPAGKIAQKMHNTLNKEDSPENPKCEKFQSILENSNSASGRNSDSSYQEATTVSISQSPESNISRSIIRTPEIKHPLPDHFVCKSRKTFNYEERQKIQEAFEEFIDEECLPSIPTIRKFMTEKNPLNAIVKENNYQPSQVKGCILNIINKRKREKAFISWRNYLNSNSLF